MKCKKVIPENLKEVFKRDGFSLRKKEQYNDTNKNDRSNPKSIA